MHPGGAGSGSRASHRASQTSLDRFRLPSLARVGCASGTARQDPERRTNEWKGCLAWLFTVSRRTHAKGFAPVGAHELAALGRCAFALRRDGSGRRQVADDSIVIRTFT